MLTIFSVAKSFGYKPVVDPSTIAVSTTPVDPEYMRPSDSTWPVDLVLLRHKYDERDRFIVIELHEQVISLKQNFHDSSNLYPFCRSC